MTAPEKLALNNINGLAKAPVLRNCGGLSRFSRRGTGQANTGTRLTAENGQIAFGGPARSVIHNNGAVPIWELAQNNPSNGDDAV